MTTTTTPEQLQRLNTERYGIDTMFQLGPRNRWSAWVDVQRNSDGTSGDVQVTPTRDGIRIAVYSGANPALIVSQILVRWDDLQATA